MLRSAVCRMTNVLQFVSQVPGSLKSLNKTEFLTTGDVDDFALLCYRKIWVKKENTTEAC